MMDLEEARHLFNRWTYSSPLSGREMVFRHNIEEVARKGLEVISEVTRLQKLAEAQGEYIVEIEKTLSNAQFIDVVDFRTRISELKEGV